MSNDAWEAVDITKKTRNGWLLTFSDEYHDIDHGLCGGEKSAAFFDIDEAIRAVKMISPDNLEGFRKADLDELVSWIKSREGHHVVIYGDTIDDSYNSYSLSVSRGQLRQEWSFYGLWETLEKSANKD
jgi:hypothetical protein